MKKKIILFLATLLLNSTQSISQNNEKFLLYSFISVTAYKIPFYYPILTFNFYSDSSFNFIFREPAGCFLVKGTWEARRHILLLTETERQKKCIINDSDSYYHRSDYSHSIKFDTLYLVYDSIGDLQFGVFHESKFTKLHKEPRLKRRITLSPAAFLADYQIQEIEKPFMVKYFQPAYANLSDKYNLRIKPIAGIRNIMNKWRLGKERITIFQDIFFMVMGSYIVNDNFDSKICDCHGFRN